MKKAALITIAAALALAPASGEAAQGKGSTKLCPDGAFCVWTKANYQGKKLVLTKKGVSNKIAKEMNNKVSSVKNRLDVTTYLYSKRDGKGEIRCFGDGQKLADLAGSCDFDNEASSSRIPKGPNPCF
jgi:hypothetical protein